MIRWIRNRLECRRCGHEDVSGHPDKYMAAVLAAALLAGTPGASATLDFAEFGPGPARSSLRTYTDGDDILALYRNPVQPGPGFATAYRVRILAGSFTFRLDTTTNAADGTPDLGELTDITGFDGYRGPTDLDRTVRERGATVWRWTPREASGEQPAGPSPVPLPATGLLLAAALGAASVTRRGRQNK